MRQVLAICILGAPALLAQSTVMGSRTVQGSWDASGASSTKPAQAGATLPGTCLAGAFFFNTAAGSGQNIYLCNPNNTWSPVSAANAATATALASTPSQCGTNNFASGIAANGNANCAQPGFANLSGAATAGQIPANLRARAIGSTFSGGGVAMTVGLVNYFTVPFACTISTWSMTVDTGSATIDVWKTATGTAIPTASNTITASATPAISSGTAHHSTTLTGWTTAVSANDIIAFQIKAVSGATLASLILECDQ